MSVYREFFHGVEEFIKKSQSHTKTYWGNTCHIGDDTYNLIKYLAANYGLPKTREVIKTNNRKTVKIVIEGINEWDPKAPKIRYQLTFIKVKHPFTKMDVHFTSLMRL